ncbi:MAG: STAS domain-containing protein [Hamadaea sp.]|nr:STAS domain-containing protein [Hamadaea sp.]
MSADLDPDGMFAVASDFRWSQQLTQGELTVRLSGELDMRGWEELFRRLRLLPLSGEDGVTSIVLDLSGLRFLDGHSAALIADAADQVRRFPGTLRVVGINGLPYKVFDILGLLGLLAQPVQEETDEV